MADGFQEMTQKLQESNSEAVKKQDEILVKSVRGHLAHRKRLQEIDSMEMEAVKSAVLQKRKTAQMEEALLLQTATDMGITVDELKGQYDSITIDPANINKLIFKPFENISKSLMEFETSFSKNLSGASGAIKELTGGVIDLGQLAQDGADKVAAVQTLILTPFKLANTAIAQTTKFFTGKEVNLGQDLADWWAGTEETIDGETKKTDGFRDKALQGIQAGVGGMLNGIKEVVTNPIGSIQKMGQAVSKAAVGFVSGAKTFALKAGSFIAGLGRTALAMGTAALGFFAALPGLIVSAAVFVGGMIAAAGALIMANLPLIGIGLLIALGVAALVAGIIYVKENFESIKATVMEKVNTFVTGVKDAVSSITEGFMNTWYSISDWVMGKILKWKGRLFGLSEEDEAELAAIEQRKADREAAKNREEAVVAEQEAIQDEFVAQQQERQNLTEAETEQLREDTAVQARVEAEQRVNDQERSVGQLEAERNALVRTQESGPTAEERNAQLEERVQRELARFDEQTADGGMVRTSERLRREDPSLSVMATADDRDAYEAALREAGNATAEDAQLRVDRENERLDRIDTLNEEIAIKKTSVLTSDAEGQELAQQMVESRVLNERELTALREEKHRESLGLSQDEYDAMKEAELNKEFFDPADEDGNFYQSQFLDDLQGTTLTADELRTAATARDDAIAEGQQQQSNVNMANNAVQQVNVANNRRVISDPAPHNPEPTGSRLSVVPA
tara:strand:- start:1063 stop:3276 length:2214 start_codon:yes stop_codon:yes gene_type:complete